MGAVMRPGTRMRLLGAARCRWRRFSGGALHEIVVAPDPNGMPGERLLAPSLSLHPPRSDPFGKRLEREDFRVMLDRRGSTLAAVCLHEIANEIEVEESAWSSLSRLLEGFAGRYEVDRTTIAGERAHGYTVIGATSVLTDWKLGHNGWLYVIGVLSPGRNVRRHERAVERGRAALATWELLSEDDLR
jgi:hypothetical protein